MFKGSVSVHTRFWGRAGVFLSPLDPFQKSGWPRMGNCRNLQSDACCRESGRANIFFSFRSTRTPRVLEESHGLVVDACLPCRRFSPLTSPVEGSQVDGVVEDYCLTRP